MFYLYENCFPCHLLVRMRRGIFVQNNILQFLFCGCSLIYEPLTWQQWYVCLYHLLACAALTIYFAISLPPKPMTGEGCGWCWLPATKCGDQLSLQNPRRSILTSLYVAFPAALAYRSICANFSIACLRDTKGNHKSCQNVPATWQSCWWADQLTPKVVQLASYHSCHWLCSRIDPRLPPAVSTADRPCFPSSVVVILSGGMIANKSAYH